MENDDPIGNLSSTLSPTCQQHPDSDSNYYCETCKKSLCSLCAPSHSTHILFNLAALASTIHGQIASAQQFHSSYKTIIERYSKLEFELDIKLKAAESKVASIMEYVKQEIEKWLEKYTKPIKQMATDVAKKKGELQALLKSIEAVLSDKTAIQHEITEAVEKKQYLWIYQRKNAIASAFLSEGQLTTLKDKAVIFEKKLQAEAKNDLDVEGIKGKVSKMLEKLKDNMHGNAASDSLVFNISPKGARAEIIDIPRKRKKLLNLGLNIEGFDAVLMKGHLYVIGGIDANGVYLRNCLAFSLSDSRSLGPIKKPDMMVERIGHTVQGICKHYIYCMGGYNSSLKYMKQCEKFDIHLNRWILLPSMNEHKAQLAACCLDEKYLYTFGGSIGPSKWLKTIELLEINREYEGWKVVDYTNVADKWTGSYCAGVVAISSYQLIIFGGIQGSKKKECYLFDKNAIQELDNALDTGASFYQRKAVCMDRNIYVTTGQNEAIVGKNLPMCEWVKVKTNDFTEF